jgi:hypothetical protein
MAIVVLPILATAGCTLLAHALDNRRLMPDPEQSILVSQIRSLQLSISKVCQRYSYFQGLDSFGQPLRTFPRPLCDLISQLSPVADFVEVSMMQRKVCKLEKTLSASRAGEKARIAAHTDYGRAVRFGVLPLLYAIILFTFWSTPIVALPAGWFSVVSVPLSQGAIVGIFCWVCVVHFSVSAVTRLLAQELGLYRHPPGNFSSLLTSML